MKKDNSAILQEYGMKATAPRLAVLEALAACREPRSAQDIHAALPKKADIDLVTVYRTLASFEKAHIAKRLDLRADSVLYELNAGHHHHIVCTACGLTEDFDYCEVEEITERIALRAKGFASVDEHAFELFGTCTACAEG